MFSRLAFLRSRAPATSSILHFHWKELQRPIPFSRRNSTLRTSSLVRRRVRPCAQRPRIATFHVRARSVLEVHAGLLQEGPLGLLIHGVSVHVERQSQALERRLSLVCRGDVCAAADAGPYARPKARDTPVEERRSNPPRASAGSGKDGREEKGERTRAFELTRETRG